MFTTLNVRVILWATLAMALFMNYVQWVNDYAPPPAAAAAEPSCTFCTAQLSASRP